MKIEWVQECASCAGTGLYVGMAERDGAGVVCYPCAGTGRVQKIAEYQEFRGRKRRPGVTRVYATAAGIVLAPDVVPGGVPVQEWEADSVAPYQRGNETRQHTCPAWWYQTVDVDKKPKWDECIGVGSFHGCQHFPDKAKCWDRFDKESPIKVN